MALVVAVHTRPPSDLTRALRMGWDHVVEATDGQELHEGCAYVAPPGSHLVVEPGRLRLSAAAPVNRVRPAVDVLFRSTAAAYDSYAVGVVLSGTGDDGSAGLAAIRRAGGMAFVQDPGEAQFTGMPDNAMRYALPDAILPAVCIAREIARRTEGDEPPARAGDPGCSTIYPTMRTGEFDDALLSAAGALEQLAGLERRLAERFAARGDHAESQRRHRRSEVATRRAQALHVALGPATAFVPLRSTPSPE